MGAVRWLTASLVIILASGCGDTQDDNPEPLRNPTVIPEEIFADVLPGVIFTRGPGGLIVPGAVYDAPEDVLLFGAGLQDGVYTYILADENCEQNLMAPGRANPIIPVNDGKFGPLALAPFTPLDATAPTTQPGERHRVYVAPVEFITDPAENCFGFPPLASLTTDFALRTTEATVQP